MAHCEQTFTTFAPSRPNGVSRRADGQQTVALRASSGLLLEGEVVAIAVGSAEFLRTVRRVLQRPCKLDPILDGSVVAAHVGNREVDGAAEAEQPVPEIVGREDERRVSLFDVSVASGVSRVSKPNADR